MKSNRRVAKRVPNPPEMIREELKDTLKKAMKKIANGEPLNINEPVAFDTDQPRDDFREGVIVYHILRAIWEGRPPTPFVRNNLAENPLIIVASVEKLAVILGSETAAFKKLAGGDEKATNAIKQKYYTAKRAQKEQIARIEEDLKRYEQRILNDRKNTEAARRSAPRTLK